MNVPCCAVGEGGGLIGVRRTAAIQLATAHRVAGVVYIHALFAQDPFFPDDRALSLPALGRMKSLVAFWATCWKRWRSCAAAGCLRLYCLAPVVQLLAPVLPCPCTILLDAFFYEGVHRVIT